MMAGIHNLAGDLFMYMYNVDLGKLGARAGFVFAASSVLHIWGAWSIVPDMTGLSAEDIDNLY